MNDHFRQRVLQQIRSTARAWSQPIMKDSLSGARTFAVSLLIDLPETNMTEAEALVDAAIAEAHAPEHTDRTDD
jgi:hypothetical protein